MEVTSVTVLPADEEPATRSTGSRASRHRRGHASPTGCPGIRDEHEDEGGWQARWLDRPTWDRTVTPNIRRRTGQRPARRRGTDRRRDSHRSDGRPLATCDAGVRPSAATCDWSRCAGWSRHWRGAPPQTRSIVLRHARVRRRCRRPAARSSTRRRIRERRRGDRRRSALLGTRRCGQRRDSLVVETTVRNTPRRGCPPSTPASAAGVTEVILARTFVQPEGATYTGSLDAARAAHPPPTAVRSVPRTASTPRVVTWRTRDVPDCVRPTRRAARRSPRAARSLNGAGAGVPGARTLGGARIGPDGRPWPLLSSRSRPTSSGSIDILAPDDGRRSARRSRGRRRRRRCSSVLDRAADAPAMPARASATQFDRTVETAAWRDCIEAPPPIRGDDANIISGYVSGDRSARCDRPPERRRPRLRDAATELGFAPDRGDARAASAGRAPTITPRPPTRPPVPAGA